jgi:CRP/FNR family transcriptional regulator, cyclic AMP receptor protein
MTRPHPTLLSHDLSALLAAIAQNPEDDVLRKFLSPAEWTVLADYVQPHTHAAEALLISQNEADHTVFFVESGVLRVNMLTASGPVDLATLGPGSVVGEGCFFSHLVRSASVLAESDCKVWALTPEAFDNLARHHASVALALTRALGAVLAIRTLDLSQRFSVI